MKNFLSKFKGKPLNEDQIALGMHLCFCNVKELLEDAELLKENKKYPRALSLAILSLEELVKVPLLMDTLRYSKDDNEKWRKFWKSFISHSNKQLVWSEYGDILKKFGNNDYNNKQGVCFK